MTNDNDTGIPLLIYILYLCSPLFVITGLAGVIFAYVYRDDASGWLSSHYQLQIRTFWISLLILLLAIPLTVILVGYFILLFWLMWFLIRCIKGIRYLNRQQAHPNPQGWGV